MTSFWCEGVTSCDEGSLFFMPNPFPSVTIARRGLSESIRRIELFDIYFVDRVLRIRDIPLNHTRRVPLIDVFNLSRSMLYTRASLMCEKGMGSKGYLCFASTIGAVSAYEFIVSLNATKHLDGSPRPRWKIESHSDV